MTRAVLGLRWAPAAAALLPALALASEDAAHGEGHGIPWNTLLFSAVNFGIFVYFIVIRGILPAVRRWAAERRGRVVRELEEAGVARREAEALRAEWERRVARLKDEIAAIRAEAAADANRERDRILEAARAAAAAIEADAKRAMAQELRRARAQLQEEAARAAIAAAERLIREHMSADDRRRYVDEFLRRVTQ